MQSWFTHEYYNENGYNIALSFTDDYPTLVIWPGDVYEGELLTIGLDAIRTKLIEEMKILTQARRNWEWQAT